MGGVRRYVRQIRRDRGGRGRDGAFGGLFLRQDGKAGAGSGAVQVFQRTGQFQGAIPVFSDCVFRCAAVPSGAVGVSAVAGAGKGVGRDADCEDGVLFYGISEIFSREGNLKKCKDVMDQLGIAYEEYDAGQLKERFSTLKDVPNSASGLFQADAGFTHAERTLRALYKLAKGHGASLRWQGRRSTISGRFRSSGRGFWVSEMCGLRNKSLSTRNPKFAGGYKPCELIRLR